MKMNIPVIFQFLKDLSANNNRDWFNEHRAEYETARVEFENFLATVIARISLFDESIRGIQPKDCTYRIYRDTRFSTDKTPYKIHFGGYINAKEKKIRSLWLLCASATCWIYACRRELMPAV